MGNWFIIIVLVFYCQVDEFSRDVYKMVKTFTMMARKEKDKKEKEASRSTTTIRTRKENQEDDDGVFAPFKVAQSVQQQIKEFKVRIFLISQYKVKNGFSTSKF